MKNITQFALIILLAVGLTACGHDGKKDDKVANMDPTEEQAIKLQEGLQIQAQLQAEAQLMTVYQLLQQTQSKPCDPFYVFAPDPQNPEQTVQSRLINAECEQILSATQPLLDAADAREAEAIAAQQAAQQNAQQGAPAVEQPAAPAPEAAPAE